MGVSCDRLAQPAVGVSPGSYRVAENEFFSSLLNSKSTSSEYAVGPLMQRCRAPISDGIVLVGDASGYLDAITGEGNSSRFKTGSWSTLSSAE